MIPDTLAVTIYLDPPSGARSVYKIPIDRRDPVGSFARKLAEKYPGAKVINGAGGARVVVSDNEQTTYARVAEKAPAS
jgi:hypothetical protein